MKKDNRELLESLIQNRLEEALNSNDPESEAFKEAMQAIDRQLAIDNKELEIYREEIRHKFESEREEIKQQYGLKLESTRQEYEVNKDVKRQQFELEKEVMKNNSESKRDEANRNFQMNLEDKRQQFELNKDDKNRRFEFDKLHIEMNEAKKERLIKYVEIGAAVLVTPLIEAGCKKGFAKLLCEFEKDYNFTTMAGKSLSGLFKFKR